MTDPAEMKVDDLKSELKKRRISFTSKEKKADLHDRLVAILEAEKADQTEALVVDDTIEKIDATASQDDKAGNYYLICSTYIEKIYQEHIERRKSFNDTSLLFIFQLYHLI
jgi:hypothetical protein